MSYQNLSRVFEYPYSTDIVHAGLWSFLQKTLTFQNAGCVIILFARHHNQWETGHFGGDQKFSTGVRLPF
jgi:hypothetical protein